MLDVLDKYLLLDSVKYREQEEYWKHKLSGELPEINLLSSIGEASADEPIDGAVDILINEDLGSRFIKMSKNNNLSLYILLLTVLKGLVYKYTGVSDITIGSPVYNPNITDDTLNNYVALRSTVYADATFKELLLGIKDTVLGAYKNQDYPFDKIADELKIFKHGEKRFNLNISCLLRNIHDDVLQADKSDIIFIFEKAGELITGKIAYNLGIFKEDTVKRLAMHFCNLLDSILKNTDVKLSSISLVSPDEHSKLSGSIVMPVDYPKEKTIAELFEKQAGMTPENIAVEYEGFKMTYSELNSRADSLACMLSKEGVKPGSIVGILSEHNPYAVIAMLGVLKAGGAYLPIDPIYPEERIKFMLEDSNASVLLTHDNLTDKLELTQKVIDLKDESIYTNAQNVRTVNKPSDTAYVIYTSGSTGKPKGVMITHRNLVNYIWWANKVYVRGDKLDFPLYSSISFDLTVTSVYTPLISGNSIVIYGGEDKASAISRIIEDNRVGIVKLTPTHMKLMAESELCGSSIKRLIVGGEELTTELALRITQGFNGDVEIYNEYGPTEATVGCMIHKYDPENDRRLAVPIGVPADNVQIYILDEYLNPVPVGATGEMYISGDGVSRGYLNREELTEERFIENPFVPGTRMYKTGDLARYMDEVRIEFLGRKDQQVKLRGYRIELGEIEKEIQKSGCVKEAVVIDRKDNDGSTYLCAYIVSEEGLDIEELKGYLSGKLPDYMVPAYFVKLTNIPMTANGKVDRKALPEPQKASAALYEEPATDTEKRLAEIFKSVLQIEKVGVNDNFFELGGQSLKAMVLVSRIHKEFNVRLSLTECFKSPTVKGMSEYLNESKQSIYSSIRPVEEKEYYPASSAEKRIYIINALEGGNNSNYNIPGFMLIEGKIDKDRFNNVFNTLIKRHESLRTCFKLVEEEPVQVICKEVDFSVEYTKKTDSSISMDERATQAIQAFIRPFDLSVAPLFRVGLVELGEDRHLLMCDMHHIISDGISMDIFIREIISLCNGYELPELRIQYKDFSEWQNKLFKSDIVKKQEEYWMNRFSGDIPVLDMPTDYIRPAIQSFEGDSIVSELGSGLSERLAEVCSETGTTAYMLLLAAYNILLSKYSGQEDIIVGTPIAGRPHADLENIIGMFVNTLAMRNMPKGGMRFSEFLQSVKETALEAYENQDYQFDELVEKLDVKRDMSRNPLFDTLFALQNVEISSVKLDNFNIVPYNYGLKLAKFDILLTAIEKENGIQFDFNYCTKIFKKQTIERMASHLNNIIKCVLENPDIMLSDIEMLSGEEKRHILYDFNDTKSKQSNNKTMHELFEEQAEKHPERCAISFGDIKLSYRELSLKSSYLAGKLRDRGVSPNTVVGLFAENSVEMIVGIMGILKAGGAYVPLDTNFPAERILGMLHDSGAKLLLAQEALISKYCGVAEEFTKEQGCEVIKLEEFVGTPSGKDISKLENVNDIEDLAYVIYTSGSTGKPKGSLLTHKNAIRVVKNTNYIDITENDKVLQSTNYGFDCSVFNIFGALLNGAELVIPDKDSLRDVDKLSKIIEEKEITVFCITTAMFNILIDLNIECLKNVRKIVFAGEKASFSHTKKAYGYLGKGRLINGYGPTEAAVFAVCHVLNEFDESLGTIPIGKPITDTQIVILDKYLRLQPVGVKGELCISGYGLAKGYLNQPEITREKFVPNPHIKNELMYKTGDIAKWLPDGNIIYVERADKQLKLRGFRIELGEIEAAILGSNYVDEAIVIDRQNKDGDKYLCAYVIVKDGFTVKEIKKYLSDKLPYYMIPSYFTVIDSIPLTPNGKVDKNALPEPDIDTGREYVPLNGRTEEKLGEIWKKVLEVDRIGAADNFFELGGHSLRAMVVTSKIHKELNVEIPLSKIFEFQTVRELAEYIEHAEKSIYTSIKQIGKKPYYEVSSAEKRVYVLKGFEGGEKNYNIPFGVIIEGKLSKNKLEEVFREIIRRHETLRTSFEMIDGEPVQIVHDEVEFKISCQKAGEKEAKQIFKEFIQPFDLKKAPLLRAGLVKLGKEKHLLMCDMHHIISDGVSMSIFIRELMGIISGEKLPELKLQYKDFAAWQNALFKSDAIKKQEEYWINKFKGDIPVLNLPSDYRRPLVQSFDGDMISFEISREVSEKLKKTAAETGTTLYMLLLAAYNVLLHKYTGQEDIVVGTPIAGRPHADLENIIGMFVNTLALRNYPEASMSFAEFLDSVRQNVLEAFENQDYQFDELVEKLNVVRDISRNPLFDTVFLLQNMESGKMELNDYKIYPFEADLNIAKFDITVVATENEETILFGVSYCTRLFKRETMERFTRHFAAVLEKVADNSSEKLRDIAVMTEEEKEQIIEAFNNTKADYPKDKTICRLFEEQAAMTPDNTAVEYENFSMTYRELNSKADSLAVMLIEEGVKPESIVGILSEHNPYAVIAMLGVLKAGGAYLPIDPIYPEERIKFMLEDSNASVLLTHDNLTDKLELTQKVIDLKDESIYADTRRIEAVSKPTDPAYVIYTSGSTGKPKGVMITHRNLVNYIWWAKKVYVRGDKLDFPLYSSISFDLTVTSVYTPLISGNSIVIYGGEDKASAINRIIEDNRVGIVKLTPTHMKLMAESELFGSSIKRLIVGGEELTTELARRITEGFGGNVEIYNEYGPTEATVGCMIHKYDPENDRRLAVPVGVPADNVQIYILDECLNPVQAGAVGEMYISGDGVSKGYLNRKELTEERFIENPFIPGTRMYKTGDLARHMDEAGIEFLGRKDQQVKIRGYRIELGEIEKKIQESGYVREAVVIDRKDVDGSLYLCAYIVPEGELSITDLRSRLLEELPEYMMPSYFVQLEEIPVTSNGKINRNVLPEPKADINREYVPLNGEIEEKLGEIWKQVLRVERIGATDNFFELGGHSLSEMVVIARIHKELNVEIPLAKMFDLQTVRELAKYIESAEKSIYDSIKQISKKPYYETSSAEKRLYVLNGFEGTGTSYNIPFGVIIEGKLFKDKLEEVFKEIVKRHETLRTSFDMADGQPVQIVHDEVEFGISYCEAEEKEAKQIFKEFIQPFDLRKAPLIRVGLVKLCEEKHLLMCDMHHIISDGVSMGIFISELMGIISGEQLPELKLQYKDFAAWQNELFKSDTIKKQEEYWLDKFKGDIPVLNLPTDYTRPLVQSFEGGIVSFEISKKVSEKLKKTAVKTGTTLYMLLLASYNVLLHKYTGQEDIVVGTPIAGRPHADLENIIGMFVNTLALRNYPVSSMSFAEFLGSVRQNVLEAFENQDYQFDELVEKLDVRRDISRNPLFDTMFSLQNMESGNMGLKDYKMYPFETDLNIAKFDISVDAAENEKGIWFGVSYCTRLFKRESIENFTRHFAAILEKVADDPEAKLRDIEIMTAEEKKQILEVFNNTKAEYPKDKTICRLIEEQAAATPDNTAVEYEDLRMTYRELNSRADSLAAMLIEEGVKSGSIVGILGEHNPYAVIAMLGVLKAGGAYLPIDPIYPEERIKFMLEDSNAEILLTHDSLTDKLELTQKVIDLKDESIYANTRRIETVSKPTDPAYVIYTSGSTGKPKGVMITHRNLVNYIWWANKVYVRGDKLDFPLYSSISFDLTVTSVYTPLISGNSIVIYGGEDKASAISRIIEDNRVGIVKLTPTHMKLLAEAEICGSSIKRLIVGGEELATELARQITECFNGNVEIYNEYGPTEATVGCMIHKYDTENDRRLTVPVGVPADNVQIYILDEYLNPVPAGATGEMYISGDGVSKGYINRKELTEERFIENPFVPGTRMYKTGDLARHIDEAGIEFLGRKDQQVKIRGYRIEPGEIEKEIQRSGYVKEAVVIDRKDSDGSLYLCAYIVPEGELNVSDLRAHLLKKLPEYMIPSYFVQLGKIPMTSNGKINRNALPEPKVDVNREYVPLNGEIEEKLGEIWKEVLRVERIGAADNFFELGGHSLRAMAVVSKIHKELNVEIPLSKIFKLQRIRELAEYIKGAEKSIYASIEQISNKSYYEASSAEKRLYVLNSFDEAGTSYNMPFGVIIEGKLYKDKLEEVFGEIIKRHETLRTSFEIVDGELVQIVHDEVEFGISYCEAEGKEAKQIFKEFIQPFDLRKAPLIRAGLVKLCEEKHLLMCDMHHIIADGASMGIFIRELVGIICEEQLPELKLQYKKFAAWQNALLKSDTIKKQEEYWVNNFKGDIPILNLHADYERPAVQSFEGGIVSFEISKKISKKLRKTAAKTGTTLYMLLLASYNVLLHKYTGQEDIIVGTSTAGRSHADLENIIGMFVNTLALRNYPMSSMSFAEFLESVRQNVLKAFENQDYQFDELVEKLDVRRDISRNPLFDTMFSLQNTESKNVELKDYKIYPFEICLNVSKFDISVDATENEEGISFDVSYCTRLFKKETMERFTRHFASILEKVADNPEVKLMDIAMMTAEEKKQILKVFNNTKTDYPSNKTVHELFEEQVEKTPDKVAVVYEDKQLSYKELNERANQLAVILRQKGIAPDAMVGIMAERSIEIVIGIMAILKAGGAYVPIDPEYPEDRIAYMLEDSDARILLTQRSLKDKVQFDGDIIELEDEYLFSVNKENLKPVATSNNLAYVIYTSGTTGKPKGVMIEHKSVVNITYAWKKDYKLNTFDVRLLQMASFSFDVSMGDMSRALLNGGMMVICPSHSKLDVKQLYQLIMKYQINILELTPAYAIQFMDYIHTNRLDVTHIKLLILGSDSCSMEEFIKLKRRYGHSMRIINSYGLTEVTIDSSFYEDSSLENQIIGNTPIGKPMQNTMFYILDKGGNLLPTGIEGELCIGGDGLSRGYLNKPELTAEKFVDNPFEPGKRMYRTGDLARWLPDGNVAFLGRIDHQVKVRGYRIELGEIESRLLDYYAVKEAVVVARENNGSNYLCAYIAGNKELTVAELREHLSQVLPDYMLPSYFVQLQKLPLTPNGKIDRKNLPEPSRSIDTGAEYEAARDEVEEKLVNIWEEVLKVDCVGINDDFFYIGGHSLRAMAVISRINKELNMEIPLSKIFELHTIRELAKYLREAAGENRKETDENLVLIKKGQENSMNMFLIHDGSGEVGGYMEFCSRLSDSFNYWGIRADRLSNNAPVNKTIEDIAYSYIQKIKKIQPDGPYYIAGWSLGGTIAFEIARQLEIEQKEIKYLALFDAPSVQEEAIGKAEKFSVKTERDIIRNILPVEVPYLEELRENISSSGSVEQVWKSIYDFINDKEANRELIVEMQNSVRSGMQGMVQLPGMSDIDELLNQLNIERTLSHARAAYKPSGKIKSQIHYFRAAESKMIDESIWNLYCECPIKVYDFEGDHYSIFSMPYVIKHAEIFGQIFEGNYVL